MPCLTSYSGKVPGNAHIQLWRAVPWCAVLGCGVLTAGKPLMSNYYYILGHERHTFQAPSLHAAITARLQRSMHHVREGFKRFKVGGDPLLKAY